LLLWKNPNPPTAPPDVTDHLPGLAAFQHFSIFTAKDAHWDRILSGNISCQVLLLEYISHSLGALIYYLHITQDEI
jgi:hypothetical protein